MGISVIVASNPRNPTGQVIKGEELKQLVQLGREGTTVILDEFYSWYQYDPELRGKSVSAAEHIDGRVEASHFENADFRPCRR